MTYDAHVGRRDVGLEDVKYRSRATLPKHDPGGYPDSQTVVALAEQLALQVNGKPIMYVEGEWETSSSQKNNHAEESGDISSKCSR
jgi:hypothetical protein